MEIKTFDKQYLQETKAVLKEIFCSEGCREDFNEWEFAQNLLTSPGYIPELCVIAMDSGKVIGYNALTLAQIGEKTGLALGPLGVLPEYQNRGVGTEIVKECVRRAQDMGYEWIALLGGNYYTRFGFEAGKRYGITVTDNPFDNDHLQLLFLNPQAKETLSGKLVYCDAFYDEEGNLL